MEEQNTLRRTRLCRGGSIAPLSEAISMRFLKGLFLALLCVVLTVSAVAFSLCFSVVSSASPSLVMTLVDEAGGTNKVVGDLLESLVPEMPGDEEFRAEVIRAAKAAIPPEVLRDLTGQAIDGLKRVLESGGADATVLLDLRSMKAAFLNEIKKNYPEAIDEAETAMEEIPDKADIAKMLPLEEMKQVSGPYRLFANLPMVSALVAAACLLPMGFTAGWMPALRIAGWCLLIGGIAVLAVTFAGSDWIARQIASLDLGPGSEMPFGINIGQLMKSATTFIFTRTRLVSGLCAGVGAALALALPAVTQRRAEPKRPTV